MRVEREGEPPRTFALKRAPELDGLARRLHGILSGDAAGCRSRVQRRRQRRRSGLDPRAHTARSQQRRACNAYLVSGAATSRVLRRVEHSGRRERHAARRGCGSRRSRPDATLDTLLAIAALNDAHVVGVARARALDRGPRRSRARSCNGDSIGSDLRLFLPSPATPEQRLLLEGHRRRARVARARHRARRRSAGSARRCFARARRGTAATASAFASSRTARSSLEAFPEELLPYRFLLSPTLDERRFDSDFSAQSSSARPRSRVAGRTVARAVVRARPNARAHEGAASAGSRCRSRAASSTFGSIATARGAADRGNARAGLRSGGPTRGARGARAALRSASTNGGALRMTVSGAGKFSDAHGGSARARRRSRSVELRRSA